MTDDLNFVKLAKCWKEQQTPSNESPCTADLVQAKQRQRRQRLLMYLEWLGALVAAIATYWVLINIPNWLGYLSAAFLIFGAISTFYVSWQVHRPIVAYENWTSRGIVQFYCRAHQLTLLYYRYTQLSCAALILFTALLWILSWWQPGMTSINLLLIYSLVVSPLCLWVLVRLQKKIRHKNAELSQLTALLVEYNE